MNIFGGGCWENLATCYKRVGAPIRPFFAKEIAALVSFATLSEHEFARCSCF